MTAEIGRLLTAMVTPFDKNGALDYAQARRLAKALVASGSDGLVIAGTTGESPTLTHAEKLKLFAEIKAEVGKSVAVVAGTGNYSTAESIELSKEAEHVGVDALLLTVPYYNKPTQEGLFQHFSAIARATRLPSIVYNVPARTVTSMSADTTVRLSKVDNIVGVKEASGDMEAVAKIIADARSGFRVWSGNDADTFAVMAMGGYGVVSVASHLVGNQIKRMMERIVAGDVKAAAQDHLKLMSINKTLFAVTNPIPVKHALNKVGINVGAPRLPLLPLLPHEEKAAATLDAVLKSYTMDILSPARG